MADTPPDAPIAEPTRPKKRGKNGGARKGAGRPKGSASIRTREAADRIAKTGALPVEVMVENMRYYWARRNTGKLEAQHAARDRATEIAAQAAPYLHPKLNSVNVGGQADNPLLMLIAGAKETVGTKLARLVNGHALPAVNDSSPAGDAASGEPRKVPRVANGS